MEFAPLLAMGALVFTVVNFLKAITNKNWSHVATQLCAWVAGIIVVLLVAKTDYARSVNFGNYALNEMNFASLLFIGLSAAAIFGALTEFKKAFDNSDTSEQPALFPSLE